MLTVLSTPTGDIAPTRDITPTGIVGCYLQLINSLTAADIYI